MENIENALALARVRMVRHLADAIPACEIWYTGTNVSATVTVDGTTKEITLHTPAGTVAPGIGTAGLLDTDTAYTTWGALADTVNGHPDWHCRLISVLRSAATDGVLVTSATARDCSQSAVQCLMDTGVATYISLGVCPTGFGVSGEGHRNSVFWVQAVGTDASNDLDWDVYECDDVNKVERLVFSLAGAATTAESEYPLTGPFPVPLHETKPGNRLLLIYESGTGASPSGATDYIEAIVRTAKLA